MPALPPTPASSLAALVQGTLSGPDRAVTGVAPYDLAGDADLAFRDRPGAASLAGVLLTRAPQVGRTCIVVADPLAALVSILDHLLPEAPWAGPAVVAPSAVIHRGVVIAAGCVVGAGTVLYPNVVLYPGTTIGARCRVHAGTVLGADGFRYHPTARGPLKVPHVAGLRIGDDVEIGANCTIDRGFLDDTVIGDGCKLDDQVHVGHNCRLGRYVIVAAQTGISGSCVIGDGALIGGQVGIADHTTIGAGARIGAQSGLHGTIPAGETWLGTPALPVATMRRVYALTRDLPAMWRTWRRDG